MIDLISWGVVLLMAAPLASPIEFEPANNPKRPDVVISLSEKLQQQLPVGAIDSAQGEEILRLQLESPETEQSVPILGHYQVKSGKLIFTPRFSLTAGERYRAIVKTPDGKTYQATYQVPKPEANRPRVKKVYPSTNRLPANLLKFYIHFSQPMRESEQIFTDIQLLDADDSPLPFPWRRTEIWNEEATRLTLFIHPGRIKQGVNLREELGTVLKPNQTYTLRITAKLKSAQGQPLEKEYRKTFTTTEVDSNRPLPQEWNLIVPDGGTRDALKIAFPESLDRHLLTRCLKIEDQEGRSLEGQISLDKQESRWNFTPNQPWQAAKYRLQVHPILEDLAGNTPERIFDTDLQQPRGVKPQLTREFQPK